MILLQVLYQMLYWVAKTVIRILPITKHFLILYTPNFSPWAFL